MPSKLPLSVNKIQLCIVTGQTLANFIPILQLKPDLVYLLTSDSMLSKAKAFQKLLFENAGYQENQVDLIKGLPDHSLEAIEDWGLQLIGKLEEEYPKAQIQLNATGGNKLMTLGLVQGAAQASDQIEAFYTDTEHHLLEWLQPRNRQAEALQNMLTVENYLLANGKTPRRAASDDPCWLEKANQRKTLSKWLAKECQSLGGFFSALNFTLREVNADNAALRIKKPFYFQQSVTSPAWKTALQQLEENGLLLRSTSNPSEFTLSDTSAVTYLTGGWIEEYVWHCLSDEGLKDARAGLEFTDTTHNKKNVRNELDAVAVHQNRLLIVECKTRNYKGDEQKISDAFYKLESLGRGAGGLFGQKWFVTARQLGRGDAEERDLARAQSNGIQVIGPDRLPQLPKLIRHWLEHLRL